MSVVPLPPHGRWAVDLRGGGRAVRVSARAEAGFVTLSTWKAEGCVSTVRLLPDEASELMAGLAAGLARLAATSADAVPSDAASVVLEERLRELERRLEGLEAQGQ